MNKSHIKNEIPSFTRDLYTLVFAFIFLNQMKDSAVLE